MLAKRYWGDLGRRLGDNVERVYWLGLRSFLGRVYLGKHVSPAGYAEAVLPEQGNRLRDGSVPPVKVNRKLDADLHSLVREELSGEGFPGILDEDRLDETCQRSRAVGGRTSRGIAFRGSPVARFRWLPPERRQDSFGNQSLPLSFPDPNAGLEQLLEFLLVRAGHGDHEVFAEVFGQCAVHLAAKRSPEVALLVIPGKVFRGLGDGEDVSSRYPFLRQLALPLQMADEQQQVGESAGRNAEPTVRAFDAGPHVQPGEIKIALQQELGFVSTKVCRQNREAAGEEVPCSVAAQPVCHFFEHGKLKLKELRPSFYQSDGVFFRKPRHDTGVVKAVKLAQGRQSLTIGDLAVLLQGHTAPKLPSPPVNGQRHKVR